MSECHAVKYEIMRYVSDNVNSPLAHFMFASDRQPILRRLNFSRRVFALFCLKMPRNVTEAAFVIYTHRHTHTHLHSHSHSHKATHSHRHNSIHTRKCLLRTLVFCLPISIAKNTLICRPPLLSCFQYSTFFVAFRTAFSCPVALSSLFLSCVCFIVVVAIDGIISCLYCN